MMAPVALVMVRKDGGTAREEGDERDGEGEGGGGRKEGRDYEGEGEGRAGSGEAEVNGGEQDADGDKAQRRRGSSGPAEVDDLALADDFVKRQQQENVVVVRPLVDLLSKCTKSLPSDDVQAATATLRTRLGALWATSRLAAGRNDDRIVEVHVPDASQPQLTLSPGVLAALASPDTSPEVVAKLQEDALQQIANAKIEHVRIPASGEYERVAADVEQRWLSAARSGEPFHFACLAADESVRAIVFLPGAKEQVKLRAVLNRQDVAPHAAAASTSSSDPPPIAAADDVDLGGAWSAEGNPSEKRSTTRDAPNGAEAGGGDKEGDSAWWKSGRLDPDNKVIHSRYAIKESLQEWGPTIKRTNKGDRTRKPKISELVWSKVQNEVPEDIFKKHFDLIYASWRRREKSGGGEASSNEDPESHSESALPPPHKRARTYDEEDARAPTAPQRSSAPESAFPDLGSGLVVREPGDISTHRRGPVAGQVTTETSSGA